MRILAVGDSFVTPRDFEIGLADLGSEHRIRVLDLDMEAPFGLRTDSDRAIKEYAGNPQQLIDALTDEDVLLVHAAPVTDSVLDASPNLRVVGVARGGPVNVDIRAATDRGITVITAPGRNADAVADLTIAFMIILARGVMTSAAYVAKGGPLGESTFEGAQFFGYELVNHTLGLVGFGNVGARVAKRALPFGVPILVYDPYVDPAQVEGPGVRMVSSRDDLLAHSDFVSLHLRATSETVNSFNAEAFATMKPGSFFINTARETLVDEQALYDAVASKHIAGAALDVVRPQPKGQLNPLLDLPTVLITPHIGGATYEAALRGVQILAQQLKHYAAGERMLHAANEVPARSTL